MTSRRFTVIVPVFNRPAEVAELLESLCQQTFKDFDVIIIEDGSSVSSEAVYQQFVARLAVAYYFKPNSGPGPSRNFGFEKATGEFVVLFDSDCIIPSGYFETVDKSLRDYPLDVWGGPDKGSASFTALQQAMAYTMSSVFTTGGIRGGSSADFQPRSFNMGVRRTVYQQTGGFRFDRYAEDIEWSFRLIQAGFRVGLIPDAYVYHKRRTDLKQFFRQVSNFGRGRAMVGRVHPNAIRITHWLPTGFLLGLCSVPIAAFVYKPLAVVLLIGYAGYLAALMTGSFIQSKSLKVALLSGPAAVVQLTGYGFGFLSEIVQPGTRSS